jgi:cytochrome c oxidase subunit 2
MIRKKLIKIAIITVFSLATLAALSGTTRVHANDAPVVEITAKRFGFTPDKITLKQGQPTKLRIHSEDVTHGFFLRPLKLDEEIPPGKTVEVTVTPPTAGTFTLICHHFCGAGHGNMNMIVVVE